MLNLGGYIANMFPDLSFIDFVNDIFFLNIYFFLMTSIKLI